jgi:hypothetical protein
VEFKTDSKTKSKTDFNLLAAVQFFDGFITGISEIKKVCKDEVLEIRLQIEEEFNKDQLFIKELKVLYYSFLCNSPESRREHRSVRTSIVDVVFHCSRIVTENETLRLLCRIDRDAKLGDVLVTARGTSMPLLLRPTKEDGECEYLGVCRY